MLHDYEESTSHGSCTYQCTLVGKHRSQQRGIACIGLFEFLKRRSVLCLPVAHAVLAGTFTVQSVRQTYGDSADAGIPGKLLYCVC